MKRTINVAIGGCSFMIDEDAYNALSGYLDEIQGDTDEFENKIADRLKEKMGATQIISLSMVNEIISEFGYPEGNRKSPKDEYSYSGTDGERPARKLFRDPDGKRIAGVCSGIALFLGVDVTLMRIIFLVALICGSAGFWIYLVIWIAAPEARNPKEKCELRGLPLTEENLKRFTSQK